MRRPSAPLSIRPSSPLLRLVALAAPLVLGASLSGCCDSWDGEICGVMDPDVTECPSQGTFGKASGSQVTGGPQKRHYLDMRSDADQYSSGMLCCYQVKHTSCDSVRVY